jgi:signal transduction histidine kinase
MAEAPGGSAGASAPASDARPTVVLVDDAGATPLPVREIVESEGYTLSVTDPDHALEVVRARSAEIVLLAARALGPETDSSSLHVLDRLRRGAPESPVILLGGAPERFPQAFARGISGVARNEADEREVRAVLTQAAQRRRLDRHRAEALEDARRMRKFFEDVLRGLGEGIVVIDEQAHIRYRNPEAARILGEDDDATPERGEIQSGSLRIQQMVLAPLLQLLVETLSEKEPKTKMIALEEEDQKLFLDVTTSVLRSGDGRTTGAVAVVRDRSAEKILEEQLAHTERLATLGSLLAAIAHEIANPLSVITGCAEVGQETAREAAEAASRAKCDEGRYALQRLSKDVKDILDQVRDAGLRCQTIANNLLQYSRRTPARVAEQDLNELVRKTLSFVGKYLGTDKVELTLELDPALPNVKADAAQLQQALTNLIDNAVHAMLGQRKAVSRNTPNPTASARTMPGDAKAPSSTELRLGPPRLKIATLVEGSNAVIVVSDNGPGIPSRQLERIWRPFYTTKERGTGLGLYITKRAVEHQGGAISLETELGRGTTFTIRLPL